MKKIIALLCALAFVILVPFDALAASNIGYVTGVTSEMCSSSYWANKSKTADKIIMTPAEIAAYNQLAIDAPGTNCYDIENLAVSYDAEAYAQRLINSIEGDYKTRDLYIGTEKLDNRAYFDSLKQAVADTSWKNGASGTRDILYAVCTKQADVMALPSSDVILYSLDDPDSEYQLGALKVNDAVVIKQKCDYQGETFYYVIYNHLYGWVNAENLAICADKQQWLDSWKVDVDGDDFIVATQDKIVTEPSIKVPSTSEVKLTVGTVLKLVPQNEIPENIGERNSFHNYVVYLPTRDADGGYVKQPALISQHYDVSVGFLPMTERNILKVAFSCLGNRYGWSGMLDSMDCSLYNRDVYRCFGLSIPRNTTWQQKVPNTLVNIENYTDAQKQAIINKLPLGSMLYFSGHTMLYIGSENGVPYVISDTGSLSNPDGELKVVSTYSVIINPLTARRKSGLTWLSILTSVVIPANYETQKYKPNNGWLNAEGKWYFLNSDGSVAKGWLYNGGKWYYLNNDGAMHTGWLLNGGKWYYLTGSGAMKTGWLLSGGNWYYLTSSGAMHTGWLLDGGKWYYMESSGAMLADTSKRINGKTYYFNSSGACTNP